jgi:hypothetical protein
MKHQFGGPEPDNYPMHERIARDRVGPATQMADARRENIVVAILRDVAELPDRTSPADWPDAMLVTTDELRAILLARIPLQT